MARGRPKKVEPTQFPRQFWAVIWNDTVIGPFTEFGKALDWADEHDSMQVLDMHAPLLDEPNKGHEIGRFLLPKELFR